MRFRSSARLVLELLGHGGDEEHAEPAHRAVLDVRARIGARHRRERIVRRAGVLVDERDAAGRHLAVEPHRRVAVRPVAVHHRVGEELLHQERDPQAHRPVEPGGRAHLGEKRLDLRQGVAAGRKGPMVSRAAHWAIVRAARSASTLWESREPTADVGRHTTHASLLYRAPGPDRLRRGDASRGAVPGRRTASPEGLPRRPRVGRWADGRRPATPPNSRDVARARLCRGPEHRVRGALRGGPGRAPSRHDRGAHTTQGRRPRDAGGRDDGGREADHLDPSRSSWRRPRATRWPPG